MRSLSVFVGLDYHSSSVRVCLMGQDGEQILNRDVNNSVAAVVELIHRCGERLGDGGEAMIVEGVAIEACTGSAEFAACLIDATGWTVKLAHASAVHRLKQGPDKTDHGDAWHLANLLRVNYLPEVWLADQQTRQLRHMIRYRQSLVADARDVKLRIRSMLKEDGVRENSGKRAWTKAWQAWLKQLTLPEHSQWLLHEQLSRLDDLQQRIAAVDQRMQEATKDDAVVQKLLDQTNVGLVTAMLLRAVVGRFDRFKNGKQLSRYCGLTPQNASSGKRVADAGLVPTGHRDLRSVLIQMAKRLPRGKESHWKEMHERLRKTKPANVVSAAIANRWLRRLHHEMVATETEAAQAV